MLKTGFEALIGTSKTDEEAEWLKTRFQHLADNGAGAEATEHLLWSPGDANRRQFIRPDTGVAVACTDLEHWFMSANQSGEQQGNHMTADETSNGDVVPS